MIEPVSERDADDKIAGRSRHKVRKSFAVPLDVRGVKSPLAPNLSASPNLT